MQTVDSHEVIRQRYVYLGISALDADGSHRCLTCSRPIATGHEHRYHRSAAHSGPSNRLWISVCSGCHSSIGMRPDQASQQPPTYSSGNRPTGQFALFGDLWEKSAVNGEFPLTEHDHWQFHADEARHARAQRPALLAHLRCCGSPESDFEAAEIIFGELISNVIRHADGYVRVTLLWEDGFAVLYVRDSGPGFNHDFRLPSSMSESGRGLFMVHCLARRVSVQRHPDGCEVVAVLPVAKAA